MLIGPTSSMSHGIDGSDVISQEGGSPGIALVTGASRRKGIGAAIALALAREGWDVATTFWRPYDARMPWGSDPADAAWLGNQLEALGVKTAAIEADLSLPEAPVHIFDAVERALGPITALVLSHAESVDSDIMGTTVESFERHFAVNARATWLLVREFGRRFRGARGCGRIVALTSDHVAETSLTAQAKRPSPPSFVLLPRSLATTVGGSPQTSSSQAPRIPVG